MWTIWSMWSAFVEIQKIGKYLISDPILVNLVTVAHGNQNVASTSIKILSARLLWPIKMYFEVYEKDDTIKNEALQFKNKILDI